MSLLLGPGANLSWEKTQCKSATKFKSTSWVQCDTVGTSVIGATKIHKVGSEGFHNNFSSLPMESSPKTSQIATMLA